VVGGTAVPAVDGAGGGGGGGGMRSFCRVLHSLMMAPICKLNVEEIN
jgi:hypothetical protein